MITTSFWELFRWTIYLRHAWRAWRRKRDVNVFCESGICFLFSRTAAPRVLPVTIWTRYEPPQIQLGQHPRTWRDKTFTFLVYGECNWPGYSGDSNHNKAPKVSP